MLGRWFFSMCFPLLSLSLSFAFSCLSPRTLSKDTTLQRSILPKVRSHHWRRSKSSREIWCFDGAFWSHCQCAQETDRGLCRRGCLPEPSQLATFPEFHQTDSVQGCVVQPSSSLSIFGGLQKAPGHSGFSCSTGTGKNSEFIPKDRWREQEFFVVVPKERCFDSLSSDGWHKTFFKFDDLKNLKIQKNRVPIAGCSKFKMVISVGPEESLNFILPGVMELVQNAVDEGS